MQLLRKARGLTQEVLAQKCNLSADTIRRLEHGGFCPSLETMSKLSAGMDLSLATIFTAFELGDRCVEKELADLLHGLSQQEREFVFKLIHSVLALLKHSG